MARMNLLPLLLTFGAGIAAVPAQAQENSPAGEEPGAGPEAGAPQPPAPAAAHGDRKSTLDGVWDALTLHKDDDSPVLNELRLVGRFHLDRYAVDSDVGEDSDLLVRRLRMGARARLFRKLTARVEVELDPEGDGPLYSRLTDAYLAWKFSDAATLTAGKHSVKFTLDGSISSNELLTIDRSNVANNFWFTEEYIPGVSVSGETGPWSYNSGLYSGGRESPEFGDFEAGYFWLGSLGRDFGERLGVKRALVRADYVYNEPDPESSFTRPFEHIGSLVFLLDDKSWGFSAELTAGDGFLGQSDAFGATALPWISITDRLQLAGRYTYVRSDEVNGVRLARYENVVTRGRGDRYSELYAGLNYLIYGHRLKAQTGVTYADMRDRAKDGGTYQGWNWTTALRVSW